MARAHYLLHWEPLEWLLNYCSYFSPNYLFFSGDTNLRHSIRGMGQLHSFEMATVAAGLLFCLLRRSRADALVVLWLLLYPLPSAANRTRARHSFRRGRTALCPAVRLWIKSNYRDIHRPPPRRGHRYRRTRYSGGLRAIRKALFCRLRRIRRDGMDAWSARGICRSRDPPAHAALSERRDLPIAHICALLHRLPTGSIPARSAAQRAPRPVELSQVSLWQ